MGLFQWFRDIKKAFEYDLWDVWDEEDGPDEDLTFAG